MNTLKYEFINEDHKRMHEVLLRDGWSCENDAIEFKLNWNWLYSKNNECICFDNGDNNVISYPFRNGKTFAKIADFIESELKVQQEFHRVDKVEILSDALYDDGDSVLKYGYKSAIGEIGIILTISDDACFVGNLSKECGKCWWYKSEQLRKVEDKQNNKDTKMELKYDFINEDHKRMHNALIAAGWTCENDAIPFNCKNIKWKWVYKKGKESIYFDSMHFDILHRNINDKRLKFHYTLFSEVADIIEAELKAIRDTNPDEEIKMQEDQEYYPITKDNIVEVLEYNKIDNNKYSYFEEDELSYARIRIFNKHANFDIWIEDTNDKWLKHLEVEFGKLNPLPKPKFDFVQYLLWITEL